MDKDTQMPAIFPSSLLNDLQNHRTHDVRNLLKRLECIATQVEGAWQGWAEPQVTCLVVALVTAYLYTADSIKLSRAIEKILKPMQTHHADSILGRLEGQILSVLENAAADVKLLSRVSVLLEQSKLVQSVLRSNILRVISLVSKQLLPLTTLPPQELTTTQTLQLHALIKMVLQMCQVCPDVFQQAVWVGGTDPDIDTHVSNLVNCLVTVLKSPGHCVDCLLLCGTATCLLLNTCPLAPQAAGAAIKLLTVTLSADENFDTSHLKHDQFYSSRSREFIIAHLSSVTSRTLGPVALLRGLVTCGNTDILLARMGNGETSVLSPESLQTEAGHLQSQTFMTELFSYIHTLCQGDLTIHFQAFQILSLWYIRLTKFLTSQQDVDIGTTLVTIQESTLNLVVLNWDSPVADVPEAVVEVFTSMMTVWVSLKGEMPDFPANVASMLMSTPWHVKGKYRVWAAALKYCQPEQYGCESMENHMLRCLTTNHLAASSAALYKASITLLSSSPGALETWKQVKMPTLVEGLTSQNSLLRYNTSQYWVPVTIKLFPLSAGVIKSYLSGEMDYATSSAARTRLLHAWIIVTKTVRSLTGVSDLDNNKCVEEALYSMDEDVRLDAIGLLCNTLKKAENLSETEDRLLRQVVPVNVKVDSAPFRQLLVTNIRRLLIRLRDSCTPLLKEPDKHKTTLDRSLDFVSWLHGLCIGNLFAGASYQRRKCSLDLLHVLYGNLVHSPNTGHRKGFVPETALKLLEFAGRRWEFFSPDNACTLIICLLDGSEEIQSLAYHLLISYYSWPLQSHIEDQQDPCCHLLGEGLRLCNSPKGHEGQSGATLCKLVFQKYTLENDFLFHIQPITSDGTYTVTVSAGNHGDSKISDCRDNNAVSFLETLLGETGRCVAEAERDLVRASKHFPIHCLVRAVTHCLCECEDVHGKLVSRVSDIALQLVAMCRQIIYRMMSIMSGVTSQEACPSFAEIGEAIENLLLEGQEDYNEGTSLSPEFQYMSSWCWNNIKESCVSLGEVTQKLVNCSAELPPSTVEDIRATFLSVLTKCRHKGVIEGCRSAFIRFCSALFSCTDESLCKIPAQTLQEVLSSLKRKEISSSVTRRSAGLPIIIQAILVSEKRSKKTALLIEAQQGLSEVCHLPLTSDLGLTDLPQVHGLNILNTLFTDASLSSTLIAHSSHVTILVIQLFGSPSWSIRNAATILFSTMVTRIFGQKKSRDNKLCNSLTFQELCSYYPELPPFLLSVLLEASHRDVRDICQLHPGLFPVLTLLACLNPTKTTDPALIGRLIEYRNLIKLFTRSPVYQLRHLVASSLVAMVPRQEMMSSVMSCLNDDITYLADDVDANSLHGNLLFVHRALEHVDNPSSLRSVWGVLVDKVWLLDARTGILSGLHVQLLTTVLAGSPSLEVPRTLTEAVMTRCCQDSQLVGGSVLCDAGVEFLLACCNLSGQSIQAVIGRLLANGSPETRGACLEHLLGNLINLDLDEPENLMTDLLAVFISDSDLQHRYSSLELVCFLYEQYGQMDIEDWAQLQGALADLDPAMWSGQARSSVVVIARAVCLHVQATYIKDSTRDPVAVGMFVKELQRCSIATNETERMSGVRALGIAGHGLLEDKEGEHVVSLLDVCLTLVQDEDTDIRTEACSFVSQVLHQKGFTEYPSLHSNVCYELLLEYTCAQFWSSASCLQFMLAQLTVGRNLQQVISERSTSRYSQLYDTEDNSFFAEKIYNCFHLHKQLTVMISKCKEKGKVETLRKLFTSSNTLILQEDLTLLRHILAEIQPGAMITVMTDSSVLAGSVGLVLTCDIMARLSSDCNHQNQSVYQSTLHTIQETKPFPPSLMTSLGNVLPV
ncbi:thyroid adenoma-associated protein homolog isoform X2 [Mya arenaria]|nr:thyroid adenoma-associated protein homolog isoform X2 [Mya arenaria]XP_052768693.1 thyroid adenoma-associated protein homolog isoform X2 [Mya arenaria]